MRHVCTIILARDVLQEVPLLVAMNRDERYDRPATPPTSDPGPPAVLAPRDQEAGGTWSGVNEHGVIAAIANRANGPIPERSRGLLVRNVLGESDAQAAVDRATHLLDTHQYAGCYLLVTDVGHSYLIAWDGSLTVTPIPDGVHVLVNDGLDYPPKAAAVRKHVSQLPSNGHAWIQSLRSVLADHDRGICVHGEEAGTRSSSIISVSENSVAYAHADGPPCTTGFGKVDKWQH